MNDQQRDLAGSAALLIQRYESSVRNGMVGSMSTSIYDTAWVSMIVKREERQCRWLFPDAFQLILDSQSPGSFWHSGFGRTDHIINSLAALLALLKHREEPHCSIECPLPPDLDDRISNAISALSTALQSWDISSSETVGLEIIVPTLLRLLRGYGIDFSFPGLLTLSELNEQKLAKADPRCVYASTKTTLVHSLEAYVGLVDFDRVSHHLTHGSMMGSPSSTAAYLIYSTSWDQRAEKFLRRVHQFGSGRGSGAFPSAFPSEIFEISWTLCILLEAGFSPHELGTESLRFLGDYLEAALILGNGVVGFSTHFMPDADDTAKAFETLSLLAREHGHYEELLANFETSTAFRTYPAERTPSFSANCNVLKALLRAPDVEKYVVSIGKAARFLCHSWWNKQLKDKWNIASQYTSMLLVQSLVELLQTWDRGKLQNLEKTFVMEEIPTVCTQILGQVLTSQSPDGSWGDQSCEITAYSILTLAGLWPTPWVTPAKKNITAAIERGRSFLSSKHDSWGHGENLWIEKVTYSLRPLSLTYSLAAMRTPLKSYTWNLLTDNVNTREATQFSQFFSLLPLFRNSKAQNHRIALLLAFVESQTFYSRLRSLQNEVFDLASTKNEYLKYIPFTWTAVNGVFDKSFRARQLMDMMIISMLGYQVDEFMESAFRSGMHSDPSVLHCIVDKICFDALQAPNLNVSSQSTTLVQPHAKSDVVPSPGSLSDSNGSTQSFNDIQDIEAFASTLARFVKYITSNEFVRRSPNTLQQDLRLQLARCLHAHITQFEDNTVLAIAKASVTDANKHTSNRQIKPTFDRSYYTWVQTTGAMSTGCHWSFAFFQCLVGAPGKPVFGSARQKYLAEALCQHLAVSCRMYNDHGSLMRDREEANLNSLDFPEFDRGKQRDELGRKEELFELAEFERHKAEQAFEELKNESVDDVFMSALDLFVKVTNLYGQIYVARDITPRI